METQRRGTQPSQWRVLRSCPEVVGTPANSGQKRRKTPDSNNSDITVAHSVRETSEMTRWGHRRVAFPTPADVRHCGLRRSCLVLSFHQFVYRKGGTA